jgi:hypothetical protein
VHHAAYDRLLTGIEILYCSLWLSGFACYSRTFRLSSLPTSRDSWTKRLSGSGLISRRMRFSLRRPLTEVSRHLSPLTQSLKERFRLHRSSEHYERLVRQFRPQLS